MFIVRVANIKIANCLLFTNEFVLFAQIGIKQYDIIMLYDISNIELSPNILVSLQDPLSAAMTLIFCAFQWPAVCVVARLALLRPSDEVWPAQTPPQLVAEGQSRV